MQREIRPLSRNTDEEVISIQPEYVPPEAPQLGGPGLRRVPLTLYIYRVPGKKDLFLTQNKVPDNRPTAHDVNGCCYYVRYDAWSLPETTATSFGPVSVGHLPAPASEVKEEGIYDPNMWRNMAQMPLCNQGYFQAPGCKMTLVSVDVSRESVQEIAVLIDPRTQAVSKDTTMQYPIFSGDPLFVDIYTPAYKAFGTDIGYYVGKAFTRRVFRAGFPKTQYCFASPWQGVVSLEPHAHHHGCIPGYHRRPGSRSVDAILACELRSNLRVAHASAHGVDVMAEDRTVAAQASKRLSRIRNRSSQLSDTTRDTVTQMIASGGRAFRMTNRQEYGLALAREPLGGGAGDEAKLGKLVVYPEGQSFVDLVVAVNVLLFNRLYERAMPALHALE